MTMAPAAAWGASRASRRVERHGRTATPILLVGPLHISYSWDAACLWLWLWRSAPVRLVGVSLLLLSGAGRVPGWVPVRPLLARLFARTQHISRLVLVLVFRTRTQGRHSHSQSIVSNTVCLGAAPRAPRSNPTRRH